MGMLWVGRRGSGNQTSNRWHGAANNVAWRGVTARVLVSVAKVGMRAYGVRRVTVTLGVGVGVKRARAGIGRTSSSSERGRKVVGTR